MPNKCCVPGCNVPQGFTFPKDKRKKDRWVHLIRRGGKGDHWKPSKHSIICFRHFRAEDFVDGVTSKGALIRRKRMLKPHANPTIFEWSVPRSTQSLARENRLRHRQNHSMVSANSLTPAMCQEQNKHVNKSDGADFPSECVMQGLGEESVVCMEEHGSSDIGIETEAYALGTINLDAEPEESAMMDVRPKCQALQTVSSQTDFKCLPFLSAEMLEGDQELLHYYTGLESWEKLVTVFNTLGPAVNYLTYLRTQSVEKISPLNQFILMLARLRQDIDYLPLSRMCGVSVFTAENIFLTWINFCGRQWGEFDTWVTAEMVRYFAPSDFKRKFPTTRVILDGTEVPIEKPSNPLAQRASFSSYKNRNTVKAVIGGTPGGLVSYVSPAYGGSASDRQIIERSNLPNMCDPGDSIMADKDFNVQDMFAPRDVGVNIPTFFKKKNRLSEKQVLTDRKISSKRVHIERIIGMGKTYKILVNGLNASETKLASYIISVCYMFCNFRNNVVSHSA